MPGKLAQQIQRLRFIALAKFGAGNHADTACLAGSAGTSIADPVTRTESDCGASASRIDSRPPTRHRWKAGRSDPQLTRFRKAEKH